jgi:hypothetical protein
LDMNARAPAQMLYETMLSSVLIAALAMLSASPAVAHQIAGAGHPRQASLARTSSATHRLSNAGPSSHHGRQHAEKSTPQQAYLDWQTIAAGAPASQR